MLQCAIYLRLAFDEVEGREGDSPTARDLKTLAGVLESRARELSQGLRCLVCRNENIDESNAALARDLRLVVRERLVAGDDDARGHG